MESVVTKISKFIEFTPEQKERAATVDLEEFLLRQGEKLIKSGREKRLASDHSVTVRGCEWFDHASNEGGRAVSFVQKYYGKSYVEAMSMLLGESMEPIYPQAKKQEAAQQKPFAPPVPNANMHRAFAYLLKTRGLDADVVPTLPARSCSMRTRRTTTLCSSEPTRAAVRAMPICAARTASERVFV